MTPYKGKVIIATFFYKHQTCTEYAHSLAGSLLVLDRLGIKFDYWPTLGNFHMEVCINDVLTRFYNDESATDIFLIDSDESWNPQHFVRLLLHEEEAVCGAYLQTSRKQRAYPVVLDTDEDGSQLGKMLLDGNCLLEALKVPAGFWKLSKTALKKWIDANPDRWLWTEGRKAYTFFLNEIDEEHVFHGMDFAFSKRLRDAGVQLWVDPICDVSHWGVVEFRGTLDEHLRSLKKVQENDAFEIVRQMAEDVKARHA